MARTSSIYARVEPEIKEQAENVLNQLGIPFEMKLPTRTPVAMGSLTKEELDAEIGRGITSIEEGRVYSAEEVEAEMKRDFGV
jgi:hypothetical protein